MIRSATAGRGFMLMVVVVAVITAGCSGSGGGRSAVGPYYQHDYPSARERLREAAADRSDRNVVLNNLRLGLAAMADGDHAEAELALMRAYEYLRSGTINRADRTVFSSVVHEGVRVWTGEPYEQAMAYYYLGAYHMVIGDWENARAAASNSLFSLRDFGDGGPASGRRPPSMERLVTEAERAERRGEGDFFANRYRPVESEFALGYLIAATSYVLMNQPEDGEGMFDMVREMRPDLRPLADTLQHGEYDTLLLLDVGRGPRKEAYGPDNALVRYRPDGHLTPTPTVRAAVNGRPVEHVGRQPVVDLWRLSQYPRWWSLESMRHARSQVGSVLLGGGLGAAYIGAAADSREAVYAGLAAAALGAALKGSAAADTRHLEFLPRVVFIVPLNLGPGRHDIDLRVTNDGGSSSTWHDLEAGEAGDPAVYFLRMHNAGGRGMPRWADGPPRYITEPAELTPSHRPWVLGGTDLSPPTPELLATYQSFGRFEGWSFEEFRDLYRDEGLVFQPGDHDGSAAGVGRSQWYRHATEGGRVLFTPPPGTHLFQRLRRTSHPPYSPRSDALRELHSH